MQLNSRIDDPSPEVSNRARIALEAVNPASRKFCEEVRGVSSVVAADLQDEGIISAYELVDGALRDQVRIRRDMPWQTQPPKPPPAPLRSFSCGKRAVVAHGKDDHPRTAVVTQGAEKSRVAGLMRLLATENALAGCP